MVEKELLESIERLGDNLGTVIDLTQNIYDTVKKNYGIKANTVDILLTLRNLLDAGERYTVFHTYFFKELGP